MATVRIRLGIILHIQSFSSSFFLFLFPEKIPGTQKTVSFFLSLVFLFFSGYNNMFYIFINFVQWKLKAFVID